MNQYCQYTDNKTATEMILFGSTDETIVYITKSTAQGYIYYLNYKNKNNLQQK